jgi:hypothetical protein
MPRPVDYTLTVPPGYFNNEINGSSSSLNNAWTTGVLNTLSSLSSNRPATSFSSPDTLRNNVSAFFSDCTLCQKIGQIWKDFRDAIAGWFFNAYHWIAGFFVAPGYPMINENMSKEVLQKIYWGLGRENKWMECIDGRYHQLGKYTFDRGYHSGTVEPGFIASMEESFTFANNFINSKIDADWYLLLHKHTCAHFNGDPTIYLMGQEKVGVFRGSDDGICCRLASPYYAVTREGRAEFEALDQALKTEFGNSYGLGEMVYEAAQRTTRLSYKTMSRYQVSRIFNKFLGEFYQEIDRATTPDQKLWAIARLQQRLEWLHPVRDGTSRTSTVLLNKFLTDYGFHPALLEYPHVSSCYGLAQWKQYLQDGLLKWEQQRTRLNPVSQGG